MKIITAPWTDEQVKKLNKFQSVGIVHEFTCGNDHKGDNILIATNKNWVCPNCDYTQDWAYENMLNIRKILENFDNFLKKYK